MKSGMATENFYLIVLTIAAMCSGCDRKGATAPKLRFSKSEIIEKFGQTNILVESWYKYEIMGQSGWRVCQQLEGTTNVQVLFTVEAEFQESDPGYPKSSETNGLHVIQDAGLSYVFSVNERKFLENRFTNDVYIGDLRQRQQ